MPPVDPNNPNVKRAAAVVNEIVWRYPTGDQVDPNNRNGEHTEPSEANHHAEARIKPNYPRG